MKEKQADTTNGWSEAISSIKFTEVRYVQKDLPDEAKYKVINVAKDFHNPEEQVVTFYNPRDDEGTVYCMKLSQFQETFEKIEV